MTSLALRGIGKSFGATVALEGVDLDVGPGEVVALIGENGAGKSTLLNVIAGALRPDQGSIAGGGAGVAYIRQELALFPHLSVAENILMGREPQRFGLVERDAQSREAARILESFGRAEIRADQRVGALSPAQRQVVEICRALAGSAHLILMDEPTSSLQRADVDLLFAAVRGLCARGISIVYVSHFLEEVREIATRGVVLRDGRSVWAGPLKAVSDADLIGHMVGRPVSAPWPSARGRVFGETVLVARDVCGVSLELRAGEILGIAGLVGSGRTEALRGLFGLDHVGSGELTVRQRPVPLGRHTPAKAMAAGLGFLSEDRRVEGLFPHLSVLENISMARPGRDQGGSWIERLRIKVANPKGAITRLSGGNQQKVLLGRLLHQGASILLLDEPTRGIDVGSKAEIYEQIRALAAQGKAVLLVSSYLPELFEICDRLAVMSKGRLSEARDVRDWTPHSVLQAAIGAAA